MQYEHDGMTLWFGTPDAPAPGEVISAGKPTCITIGIQPQDASHAVKVLYRVNNSSETPQEVKANWIRSDPSGKCQYYRADLPQFRAGDTVEYIAVCHCAGRTVPSKYDMKRGGSSFRVTEAAIETPGKAPSSQTGADAAAGAERATSAIHTTMGGGDGSGTGDPGPAKTPFGASTESGGGAISGMGVAADESHAEPAAANKSDPTAKNAATLPKPEVRIDTLHAVLATKEDKQAVETEFQAAKGNWTAALANLKDKLPKASFKKVAVAHSLADWSGDNVRVVKAVLAAQPDLANLRDLALRFNVDKLAALVDPKAVPETTPGATAVEKQKNFAVALRQKLFLAEPTAVIHRMVEDVEIPIGDLSVRAGVTKFLSNQPDFNIGTTSIYTALKHPESFKDIADEHRGAVVDHLKILQRVQAISPAPEAVPALMKANLTSAFHVAEKPESTFLRAFSGTLGEETARQVYTNAVNAHIRNEHALITMRQTMRGTGLAIIDGKQTREERVAALQQVTDKQPVPLNLSTLFGSLDYCECDECLSVYSPASYFVELLQFLRNNNLSPTDPADPSKPNPNLSADIADTPLGKLFRRRPDLGCLELTCENTFTVLPYIDLVNEVMESFVVHVGDYKADAHIPKQVTLETFNVEGETTSELLAIPQHVNYDAYCILKSAVYPFTLPYHQPIDATRIFLDYLKTSRWELLDTFRTAHEICPSLTLSADDEKKLQELHKTVQDRAVDGEFLGLTQEEYIILSKEAFWPKRYFEITQQTTYTDDEYRQNIGVRQVCEYYGYDSASCADMLSLDEDEKAGQKGLTFVKKQFLRRTGIQYTDLVELLKTQFINPNFPQGKALTVLESIRFSYRFLQTIVDTSSTDPKIRFAKLIEFLDNWQPLVPAIDATLHPDPCKPQKLDLCAEREDFKNWVYCYFERIGKLIVLESGEGPRLPIHGDLFLRHGDGMSTLVGTLESDGTIIDTSGTFATEGTIIGHVGLTIGTIKRRKYGLDVVDQTGEKIGILPDDENKSFQDNATVTAASPVIWRQTELNKFDFDIVAFGPRIAVIRPADESRGPRLETPGDWMFLWQPTRETCDLDKVRLTHLDWTPVEPEEYDRMHRFIRLWRKLGWTIDETDKALIGLAANPGDTTVPAVCDYVDFTSISCAGNEITVPCECGPGQTIDWVCPDIPLGHYEITPDFLHQLRAVKKLLDQTGLPLPKLLAFWANISTAGKKSLYSKLFLTHNLVAIDSVFQADANGNYLTQQPPAKITEHIPVLMAALKLKADDIAAIMRFGPVLDELTLSNVSLLYRYSLLAKILHVRVPLLRDVVDLFGNPFKSAWDTLALLETWGKMEDAGFTFRQLDYLILDRDDPLRPLTPSKKTILQLTKTLYDGLNAIDHDHRDITKKEEATSDLVRAKAGLIFEQTVVEHIIGLLEGTTVYTTNAPENLVFAKDSLSTKIKYSNQPNATPPTASIQVTGILTDTEITEAKAASNHSLWPKAIDRVGKQAKNVLNDALFGIFSDMMGAQKVLLVGDFANPDNPQDPANTAPDKRLYFLKNFLPFLRKRLSQRLIVDTLSGAAGLPSDVTNVLLSDILLVGTSAQHAMAALEDVKNKPSGAPTGWAGFLIPSADGAYSFVADSLKDDDKPSPIVIDGQSIPFTIQQEDPSNVWSSDPKTPMVLKAGKLYALQVADRNADELQWKTAISPKAKIPSSALLPDYSSSVTTEAFTKLYKAALLVNGFSLSADEASYWQNHAADFDGFDFNATTLQHWKRLQAYTDLRNNLPRTDTRLIDLFQWAIKPDTTPLSDEIAAATLWKLENIVKLIALEHFDLNRPEAFSNEINLVKLRQATIVADKIAVDIDRLFEWAKPGSKFWDCHQIAEDIRKAIRARFDEDVWEQVVKPLNDQLREHQKQALIAYLLVQQDLIVWGVIDADSLFEFFLIDVQMDSCMQTSRIKQAISSVQLFIQRCLLGLEERQVGGQEVGVPNNAIDRGRWEWMQRYRVWEANRKVFLYPENWIVSELRDDKSPFYKELESELLQKDINSQTVQDALKSYLIKVDEVANLKVVGLFLDEEGKRLHVFSRTRNAPFFFYYRYFQVDESNWYPWEKVQVDIPSYDVETVNVNGQTEITENGSYLIPVVWDKRVLIFFPQFAKKAAPEPGRSTWELKLGWSEYRNNKWTQKQVSAGVLYHLQNATEPLRPVSSFQFVPRIFDRPNPKVVVEVYRDGLSAGGFRFHGSQLSVESGFIALPNKLTTDFHYAGDHTIHSLQGSASGDPPRVSVPPYFKEETTSVSFHSNGTLVVFNHPFVHQLLGTLTTKELGDLFSFYSRITDPGDKADAYGRNEADSSGTAPYQELKRPYSIYNWEATFHAPMLLVDRLLKANQFEQALNMCHYVLNPFVEGTDSKRFWQFPPFKATNAADVLETLFLSLQPGKPDSEINAWRNKPFQPHVVARGRPAAYMKWVAMTYIEVLIAWGDYLFRQDTIETINQATQLYVLAAHVYGPHGQKIPKRGKVLPETYNSLVDKWDAFGNAMVELELAFPFSNQTPMPIGVSNGVVGLANVFGFATTLYFCIPDNPELTALRDTIDDRLFKIRHCENIAGVFRQLPLFEPPIDPALLVQAAAQGLSLSSVLNDLNSPMPNYRFYFLLQKALEVCNELKALGAAFLSAKEKGDGEALSRLRATHESAVQNLVMEVKKRQVDEAQKSHDALQQSRLGPVSRMQYYLKLIGEDLGKVPNANTDFGDLPNQIEQPGDESGLKLIAYEKEEMDKAAEAADKLEDVGEIEVLAGILHAIPNISFTIVPGPYTVGSSLGGSNLGSATQAVARSNQIVAGNRTFSSTNAGRKASFLRQLQDRVQQANSAGFEIKNIDKQILTQNIRISIANQEITNQQKQIDNAKEVEDFLRSKYTNQELYAWMESQVRTLYYQAYTLAFDLAKKAEKVFRFERGSATSNFIQFGYWDPAYDGLFAGERMYIGLKQLEAAYQEKRGYDFEIVKNISLQQLNPLELIQLRETGRCEFALPEVLFDMGYPGHYMRRIKTVALTFACVVGPPTSVNCVLRLLEHSFRTDPKVMSPNDYPIRSDGSEDRFATVNVPISSIAVSTGQNDSGVFELNFRDERYIPFEGAGAISKWRIELPKDFREFDYNTITDVVMHLRYTALDGGDKLRNVAAKWVKGYFKTVEDLGREEGLFALFDLRHDFPNEWYKATNPPAGATTRIMNLGNVYERLPFFTKGTPPKYPDNIVATQAYLFSSTPTLPTTSLNDIPLSPNNPTELGFPMKDWQLKIGDVATPLDQLWLVVRYTLG